MGYQEFPGAEVFCMKTVDVVYKTNFRGQIIDLLTMPCETAYKFSLPSYTDVFEKKATISFELDEVKDFLVFDQNTMTIQSFVDQSLFC